MRMNVLAIARAVNLQQLRLGDLAAFLAGIFLLAGAIHVSIILLVPTLAESDGWSRLAPLAGIDRFAEIPIVDNAGNSVGGLDPLFINGACRLQLGEAPGGITVDARDRFWSLALYDPKGTIVFSLNDRTAVGGRLDMIVVNPAQNASLKQAPAGEMDLTIVVESASNDLVALLRLFAPTAPGQEEARRVLAQSECLPAPSILPPA
jgi:uncharacterized membrane protein